MGKNPSRRAADFLAYTTLFVAARPQFAQISYILSNHTIFLPYV